MPVDPPIRESGRVLRVEGPVAVVEIRRSSACAHCAASGACEILGGASERRELRARNALGVSPGDVVDVEIPAAQALGAAAWVYLLPTVVILAAAVAGHALATRAGAASRADLVAALSAVVALGVLVAIALLRSRRAALRLDRLPVVVRRHPETPPSAPDA